MNSLKIAPTQLTPKFYLTLRIIHLKFLANLHQNMPLSFTIPLYNGLKNMSPYYITRKGHLVKQRNFY